jgi:hypothetical protein
VLPASPNLMMRGREPVVPIGVNWHDTMTRRSLLKTRSLDGVFDVMSLTCSTFCCGLMDALKNPSFMVAMTLSLPW